MNLGNKMKSQESVMDRSGALQGGPASQPGGGSSIENESNENQSNPNLTE
jgi:hypothetical protein